jgi:hypothetical protein
MQTIIQQGREVKFMKKIAIFCIIAMSFLAACDDKKEGESDNSMLLLLGGGGGAVGHDWTLMSNVNTAAPLSTVKLVFIHHSTGSAWIATGTGNLGQELNASNYWVVESDYGWGPTVAPYSDAIGTHTDTIDWPNWFTNSTVMIALYGSTHHEDYPTNTMEDPGGENTIIMFKSCFPNSDVGDSIDDEKAIYNGLLTYFATHTDKMFVLIVPPPMIDIPTPALTRELANWLVASDGWLSGYTSGNVYVFDYYNVLTDPKNHHRVEGTLVKNVKHVVTDRPAHPLHPDELYYPTGDSHPSATGHQKATAEFVPLLNACYNHWQGI